MSRQVRIQSVDIGVIRGEKQCSRKDAHAYGHPGRSMDGQVTLYEVTFLGKLSHSVVLRNLIYRHDKSHSFGSQLAHESNL